ncbi:MAG: putative Ig domain-containing protein [Pseudomonadota bacterium]
MSKVTQRPRRFLHVVIAALCCHQAHAIDCGEILSDGFENDTALSLPQIAAIPDQVTPIGERIEFDIDTAIPSEQTGNTFALVEAPDGMTIDASTGEVAWTPSSAQVGTTLVSVQVTTGAGISNSRCFAAQGIGTSGSPLIDSISDQVALVDQPFSVTVTATDPDPGDVLSFELISAPVGMDIDPASGEVSWMPMPGDIGAVPVRVRVSDPGGAADEEAFQLQVVAQNAPPVLEVVQDRGGAPNVPVEIDANAVDPDGDDVTYALSMRPTGMTIDPDSGAVRWMPTFQQLGPHDVTIAARDSLGASDTQSFEILVDLNRAPVAVDDSGFRVERGDTLTVPASGVLANDTDPNGDLLSSLLETGASRGDLSLGNDGSFEYTPDNPAGTIGMQLKWENISTNGGSSGGWQPLIGQLDDDPASEIIILDSGGISSVRIDAYDGDTGAQEWVRVFGNRDLGASSQWEGALADIDLDGKPEILLVGGDPDISPTRLLRLYALEHDGGLKWISESLPKRGYDPTRDDIRNDANGDLSDSAISVADLDGDGLPEIIVAPNNDFTSYQVWDANGRKVDYAFAPGVRESTRGTRVSVVDLDLDEVPEVVVSNAAFTNKGEVIWTRDDVEDSLGPFAHPQVANLDDDPYPELVRRLGGFRETNVVLALNHDGSTLWDYEFPGGNSSLWSPITIADVNNDGQAEVLAAGGVLADRFDVINGQDGTMLWSNTLQTGRSGATVFDMDRDGFNEVIYIDENSDLYVWDGRDGSEKLVVDLITNDTFPTEHTVPVFADIDADGHAELILPIGFTFSPTPNLQVWESTSDDWAPARGVWNQARYYVTNVNDDLTVPAKLRPHWLLPGLNVAMVNERLPEDRIEDSDQFSYRASDGELISNVATVDITILPPNTAPRILSSPRLAASPGFEYVYRALAVDADVGESLTWSIAEGPAGMAVDALGTVTWTPTAGDLGSNPVVLQVTDSVGAAGFQNYVIEVEAPVSVPDINGLTQAQAVDAIESAGLAVESIREAFSETVAAGLVVAQQPAAGVSAAAGDGVVVDVSLGPVPLRVPDVVALTLDSATADIVGGGLSVGTVEFVNDSLQPANTVLIQDPAPRAFAAPGSPVDITVSGGPRASIDITPRVIAAGSTAEVSVVVRDLDGTPLDPQPAVSLSLDVTPDDVDGTLPTLNATTITTAIDSQGSFEVTASFTGNGPETISTVGVIAQPISDGDGADVFNLFATQLRSFEVLIGDLITAVNANDSATIVSIDSDLGDLLDEIDVALLSVLSPIAPVGGVPPSAETAAMNGFPPAPDDAAYVGAALDLFVSLEQTEQVITEGTAPDAVINALNQDLADVASVVSSLDPSVYGVLDASEVLIALLGTRAPRVLVADIRAVRQALRDQGLIASKEGPAAQKFSLIGIMSATQLRSKIISDIYVPYLGQVAKSIATIVGADLLGPYANQGAIAGIITGGSLALHVFEIENSVIEGTGFDTLLPEGNSVIFFGPELIDAVLAIVTQDLPQAKDLKDLNSIKDAIKKQIDMANTVQSAIDNAVSSPSSVLRGCILDNLPDCRQLVYPDGFKSVYKIDSGLALPASVGIVVHNLAGGGFAVTVANFFPTRE